MTAVQQGELTRERPATVLAAAVLTVAVAAYPVVQMVMFTVSYDASASRLVPYLISAVATAACWVATVPGLLRGRAWAQVAATALSAFAVAQGLPTVIEGAIHAPDPVLLGYTAALLAPVVLVVLLWTPGARTWFGPLR